MDLVVERQALVGSFNVTQCYFSTKPEPGEWRWEVGEDVAVASVVPDSAHLPQPLLFTPLIEDS